MFKIRAYATGITAGLLALSLLAGCGDDDPADVEEEPEFTTMRLTVGNQTIDVNKSCNVSGGPIQIGAGNTSIAAQFLLANGSADPVVSAADFRLDVTIANTGLATFVRTGPFSGTLTRVAAGTTTATIALFHLGAQHNELSCVNIQLQVQ